MAESVKNHFTKSWLKLHVHGESMSLLVLLNATDAHIIIMQPKHLTYNHYALCTLKIIDQ